MRVPVNDGQEIVRADINKLQIGKERELYDRILYEMLQRTTNGFIQGSCLVSYMDATHVSVAAGFGFQYDSTQVSPEPVRRPIHLHSTTAQALNAAHATLDRIDIISIQAALANTLTETRRYKSDLVASPTNVSFVTEQDWQAGIVYTAGTASGSPVAPATPAGYILIATLAITHALGLANSAAVTDNRTKLAVGGDGLFNTTGFLRLTAGSAVPMNTLLANIDSQLRRGYLNYTDFDDGIADASSPAASKKRYYVKNGVLFGINSSGVAAPVGSGGGGGSGAVWAVNSVGPVEDIQNGQKVWLFSQGDAGVQTLTMFVKISEGYVTGRPISLYLGLYSPSVSGTVLLISTTYLIRRDTDGVDSVVNSHASVNTVLTNTVANMYRRAKLDLTDNSGMINSIAVSPGDLIRVDLIRGTDSDTADLCFIPSVTDLSL
jgi:hypothetical protein